MKNKKAIKKVAIVTVFLILIVLLFNFITDNKTTELTQLKDNSKRQMMGYIIKTNNDKVIIVDGGLKEDAENLINHIKDLGGEVEAWFLTHPHMDHVEAFRTIVETTDMQVKNIYLTVNDLEWYRQYAGDRLEEIEYFFQTIQNEKIKDKIINVKKDQIINVDNVKCEILGVCNPEITTNPVNNSSMVIKMNINNKAVIFLGDTGAESGKKLIETEKNKLKADVVQMAHHGQSGAEKEVYEIISPSICLWPTPRMALG